MCGMEPGACLNFKVLYHLLKAENGGYLQTSVFMILTLVVI